jgi:hypothetical protein
MAGNFWSILTRRNDSIERVEIQAPTSEVTNAAANTDTMMREGRLAKGRRSADPIHRR